MNSTTHLRRAITACAALLLALVALHPESAWAVNEADLLPVDQAFVLSAKAVAHDRIEIDWTIAKGYYLYRERMGASADAAFGAGTLQLPDGIHKHDPFFGDVQIYHDRVVAQFTGSPASDVPAVDLTIKYQGCADAGVCYPPQKRTLRVALPVAAGSPATAPAPAPAQGSLRSLATNEAIAGMDQAELPAEQAFGFDAIVDTPDRLLLRFTPAKGYYLYRDRTAIATKGAASLVLPGTPQWPAAQSYHDGHFGDVAVYFTPVEVPLPVLRQDTKAQALTVNVTMQGCKVDGICYPPMQRSVTLDLPAGGTVTAMPPIQPTAAAHPAAAPRSPIAAISFGLALLLALGGGLILNLMPCVLPVLSLKAIALVEAGESRARARSQALWYTAGVLVSLATLGGTAIALRQAGLAMGWLVTI